MANPSAPGTGGENGRAHGVWFVVTPKLSLHWFWFIALATSTLATAEPSAGAPAQRVLLVGIDGLRPDALRAAETPVIDRLIEEGSVTWNAFAGGVAGTPSEQKTSSGPGWSSILTGVWVDKHRVKDNSFSFNRLNRFPHFAARLKEVRPDVRVASAVSWGPIEDEIVAPVAGAFDFHVKGEGEDYAAKDASVVSKVLHYLEQSDPDVLVLHLDQVDGAGHATGFSADNRAYLDAISVVDGLIGRVLDAIRSRSKHPDEAWMTVITTDHGGREKGHGGQTVDERQIFVIASGGDVRIEESGEAVGHVVVPRLVFQHLGVPVDGSWGWEGGSSAEPATAPRPRAPASPPGRP